MKTKYIKLSLLLSLIIMNISCDWFRGGIRPASPDIAIDTTHFKKPSTISIPIEINLQPAFDLAENELPKSMGAAPFNEWFGTGGADACPHGVGCGYGVSRAPLGFAMNGNVLTTNLSIVYGLNCRTRLPDCNFPTFEFSCDNRHAHGSLSTQINIDEGWNVSTLTTNNGMIADDDCKVGFLGFINVTDKVMNGFNAAFDKVAQTLDAKVQENVKSKERITDAWNKVNEPIAIKDLGWLFIAPDSIKLNGFTLEDNTAKIDFYFKSNPEIYLGKRPAVKIRPLPNNSSFEGNNSLNIFLPVSSDYSFAENQIKRNLKIDDGNIRYPPTGKQFIKVTDVNIYGYGRKIVMKISFNGTKKGYAYLEGTPQYDAMTNVLSFPDLDYSVDTKSLMIKTIDFFKHDDFIKDLRNRLTIDLNDKVTQLIRKVDEALNKKYDDFTLHGNIAGLKVLGLYTNQNKNLFTAYFEINGELKVQVF